jgi:hypothetical protein
LYGLYLEKIRAKVLGNYEALEQEGWVSDVASFLSGAPTFTYLI